MSKGTPKTLLESIQNGIMAYREHAWQIKELPPDLLAIHVRHHVRDFLSQRFTEAMLNSEELAQTKALTRLFYQITESPAGDGECDCEDCIGSDAPCRCDCDQENACTGCREARDLKTDTEFDIDTSQGRK